MYKIRWDQKKQSDANQFVDIESIPEFVDLCGVKFEIMQWSIPKFKFSCLRCTEKSKILSEICRVWLMWNVTGCGKYHASLAPPPRNPRPSKPQRATALTQAPGQEKNTQHNKKQTTNKGGRPQARKKGSPQEQRAAPAAQAAAPRGQSPGKKNKKTQRIKGGSPQARKKGSPQEQGAAPAAQAAAPTE